MEYITSKQAAAKWGITPNRVTILCKNGNIPGAIQIGGQWMIPNTTEKPQDRRRKTAQPDEQEVFFRFPLYVNTAENEFSPPLNKEEAILRKAELDYYACNFENAQRAFDDLANKTNNIYIRIISLFYLSSIAIEAYEGKDFVKYSALLQLEFTKEFPYKKDMSVVTPWLYTITVQLQAVWDNMMIDPLYDYSRSVRPLISYLSVYNPSNSKQIDNRDIHFEVYEMLCQSLLEDGYYYETCELHFALFLAYYVSSRVDEMLFHLMKGLEIVKEHKFYVIAASYESYYQKPFDIAFKDFPEDFVKLIKHYSELISISIGSFAKKCNDSDIFSALSKSDFCYIIEAFHGKTSKEVALEMHLSERTVANHYNVLYSKLGINSKQQLIDMMNDFLKNK